MAERWMRIWLMSQTIPDVEAAPPAESSVHTGVESSVWRLGPGGLILSSVVERHAAELAEHEPGTIFFYADLGGSTSVVASETTKKKVFMALAGAGLSEAQILTATNAMQASGVVLKELEF